MNTRWSRVLRGLFAGTAATVVAAASHSVADGRVPSVVGITLALFFSVIVSIALTGRALSVVRLAASVVVSQLAFHVVFSTIGGAGEVISIGHHEQTVVSGLDAVTHASDAMWVAHAIAAAITILALRFGERAFFGMRETARMLLAALFAPTAPQTVAIDRAPLPAPMTFFVARIVRDSPSARGVRGPPLALRSA
jgi:hypothetical protein